MRCCFIIIILLFTLSCNQNLEDFDPPALEVCDYFPKPCLLINIEDFKNIIDEIPIGPFEGGFTMIEDDANVRMCEREFKTSDEVVFRLTAHLMCIPDIESTEFTNLKSSMFPNTTLAFENEPAFDIAIFYPEIENYVIQKGNYILELDFDEFTKDQQLEIATIMVSNLL